MFSEACMHTCVGLTHAEVDRKWEKHNNVEILHASMASIVKGN